MSNIIARHPIILPALLILFWLASCTTPPPIPAIVTQPVNIAIPVKCAPDIGPDPAYPSAQSIANAPDIFQQVKLLVADRIMRIAREAELLTAIKECVGP